MKPGSAHDGFRESFRFGGAALRRVAPRILPVKSAGGSSLTAGEAFGFRLGSAANMEKAAITSLREAAGLATNDAVIDLLLAQIGPARSRTVGLKRLAAFRQSDVASVAVSGIRDEFLTEAERVHPRLIEETLLRGLILTQQHQSAVYRELSADSTILGLGEVSALLEEFASEVEIDTQEIRHLQERVGRLSRESPALID